MLKPLIAGVIGIAATAGGWFAGQALAPSGDDKADDKKGAVVEQVVTEMNGAPVIVDGRVQGYVVFRVRSMIDKSKLADAKLEVQPFLTGSTFEAAYRFYDKGVPNIRPNDLPELAALVTEIANKKLGDKVVRDVEFEQLNYIPSDKIRENFLSKRQ